VLIGAMAAVTRRLRFSNAVYIAPARPLLEVAKQVATASVLSEGRVSLGVGVGWMREEYELLGQDFDTRGKRLNEMIPALRELWRGGWVGYAYAWDDAVGYVNKLTALRREYGRENEPFDILLALLEPPTPDLYKRAEDIGITAVMSAPWMGVDLPPGDAERFRAPIERFAETIIAKVRG
jgi:alkanesulfonate monooxygenase SsuD/methylene tetrahydromethanopterin reductase-like flavin-dependent oxidoreductase (luciferase family)